MLDLHRERPGIVLLIASGWGVRTFLQTEVLPLLQRNARVAVLASPDLVEPLRQFLGPSCPVEPLLPFDPAAGEYGRIYRRRDFYFRRLSRTGSRRANAAWYRRSLRGRWRDLLKVHALELEASLFSNRRALARLAQQEQAAFFREYPNL